VRNGEIQWPAMINRAVAVAGTDEKANRNPRLRPPIRLHESHPRSSLLSNSRRRDAAIARIVVAATFLSDPSLLELAINIKITRVRVITRAIALRRRIRSRPNGNVAVFLATYFSSHRVIKSRDSYSIVPAIRNVIREQSSAMPGKYRVTLCGNVYQSCWLPACKRASPADRVSAGLTLSAPRVFPGPLLDSAGARKEEPCAVPASKSRGFFSRWMANDGAIPARMRIARMAEQREQRACEREMKL